MNINNIDFKSEKTKDFIAGSLALFFLITAGWIAINKFNKSLDLSELEKGSENGEIVAEDENGKNTSKRDEKIENTNGNDQGSVNGTMDMRWVANDYQKGDIKNGSYKVVSGDTLWEIAEAVYGDGAQWTKILEANKGDVGLLPNGSQALIVVGQVLQIP